MEGKWILKVADINLGISSVVLCMGSANLSPVVDTFCYSCCSKMLFKWCFNQLRFFSPLLKDEFKIWFCAKVRIMPSLGANPLQNPNPIVHKVSNGHAVHFCESAAEENKNDLKKYLPVSKLAILRLLIFKVSQVVSRVNTHNTVHVSWYFCLKG